MSSKRQGKWGRHGQIRSVAPGRVFGVLSLALVVAACRPAPSTTPETSAPAKPESTISAPQTSTATSEDEATKPAPAEVSAEEEAATAAETEAEPAPAPEPFEYASLDDFERGGVQLEVTRRVATGPLPKSVEVSPDGKTIWVCNFGQVNVDNMWVYDAQSLERLAVIKFKGNAVETIWSPDEKTVYVSNFKRAVVEVIDAQSYEVKKEIEVGFNPKIMVATPDGKYLFVANWSSNDVTVVDLAKGEKVHRLKTGKHPRGMVLSRDGRLFVNAMYSHQIHVFDAPREKGGGSPKAHDVCKYPRHSVFSPSEDRLYVTCSGADKVYWYDPETMRRRGWATVGDNPRSMAMTDDGRFLAVADYSSSTVSLVDVKEGTYDTFELPGAEKVVGVAVAPGPDLVVYATSWVTGELIEMRPKNAQAAEPSDASVADGE